jgi:cytochrome c-type biogenesis protein CcmH/NrfG
MNRGKAYLENRDSTRALQAFERAVELEPDSAPALRNLARAYLQDRKLEPLAEVLERARALGRDSVATAYLTGLMYARQSEFKVAIEQFEQAVRLDPRTATLRFQLASAYQAAERHDEAVTQLEETLRLDPFYTAAHVRLAGYARRARDRAELERRLRETKRLRQLFGDEGSSAELLEACVYTLAESPAIAAPATDQRKAVWPGGVRFRDATAEMLPSDPDAGAPIVTAVLLDTDEVGRYTLFAADALGTASLLTPDASGVLRRSALDLSLSDAVLASDHLVSLAGIFWGILLEGADDYAAPELRSDLLLLGDGGIQAFERVDPRTFKDVTPRTGLSAVRGSAARWVDYDHDGDVDLLVGGDTGLALWQNGGDGRFENVTERVGIQEAEPVRDVAAVDLDNNVGVDLIAARGALPTRVFENQRTGQFATLSEPPGPWPAAQRVLVDELDGDAHPDAVLIGDREALIIPGRGGERRRIGLGDMAPRAAALIDFDNDGRVDLLVAGASSGAPQEGRLALWRNAGNGAWSDVSETTEIAALVLATPRHVLAADLDTDGDSDLLVITADGLRLLRNEGGHTDGQLKLRLVGTKSNPSAIGARVEVRAGAFRAARLVSFPPVEIGLAGNRELDSVQILWTNGVVENQVAATVSATPLTIAEKMVAAGSCPFLYAWGGEGFRFVTDILGNSPLGLSLRRGEVMPADPDELVWVGDPASFVPRDGHYVLELTDEMREVLYLDEVRLVAADHAPGLEVHATDRMMPAPFPASELWPLRLAKAPQSAVGDDGIDRTRAVRVIDGDFAPPGPPLPPSLRGMTRPLALTLDFGSLDDLRAPVLALTGWLQYGDASTNIAISQCQSLDVVPTTLEMQSADGAWHLVDVTIGMPAGKTKTIAIDLAGKLLPDVRRLRLRTSFELRWDRIALLERLPESALTVHTARPVSADLRWRGFSELRARAPQHPTTPAWDVVFEHPPWRTTLEGWVTRYGDIRELVAGRDGAMAILNGGDALELRFRASDFPPPHADSARMFFFYSVGWNKDGDHNVVDGDRVEPLPEVAGADSVWRTRYNRRFVARDGSVREP